MTGEVQCPQVVSTLRSIACSHGLGRSCFLSQGEQQMARHDFDPSTVTPDGRQPAKAKLFDGTLAQAARGSVNGEVLGTSVSILAYGNDEPGAGPKLHVHP